MNKETNPIRLVVSGTYSTGKTTTTTALSIATGIPMINALSAREILTDIYPGRRFQDMNLTELMVLGLRRMEERVKAETALLHQGGQFISDGSVLNEWIYGTVRMQIGINPGAPIFHQMIKAVLGVPFRRFLRSYIEAYGEVVRAHAKANYTHVVHLPVEFPMAENGHRPVSEKYRTLSEQQLLQEFQSYDIPNYSVSGTEEERLQQIIQCLDLPQVMEIPEAIEQARQRIISNQEAVAKRIIEQYEKPTLKEKMSILSKF